MWEIFIVSFVVGFIGPMAGIGGGVLFTPILLTFFNLDVNVVRGVGLMVAMTTSSVAGSFYLMRGMTKLNIVLFAASFMSIGAFLGAELGIWIAREYGDKVVKVALGILLLIIVAFLKISKIDWPPRKTDRLASALGLYGSYREESLGKVVEYGVRRTIWGALTFLGVGLLSGFFGIGGGWAMVPVYNIVMGLPLKVAVASSEATIVLGDVAGVLTYLKTGAEIHILAPMAQAGVALGAFLGARVAAKVKVRVIRWVVISVLLFVAINLIRSGLS